MFVFLFLFLCGSIIGFCLVVYHNDIYSFSLKNPSVQFSSAAQSCPTLQPHGLQHARHPCPSPAPRAYSDSCPSSQWCYPTISSSVVPFSSHFQSFPASVSFPVSQVLHIRWPKYWSFSFIISLSNEYSGLISLRMDWLDLLAVQGTLKSFLQHHNWKASILWCSAYLWSNSYIHAWLLKKHSFNYTDLCWQSNVSAV